MFTKTLVTTVFALGLVACGGNAESDSDPGVGGSGASGGATTGGSGGAATGGASTGGTASGGAPSGGSGGVATGGTSAGGNAGAAGSPSGGTGGQGECVPQPEGTGGINDWNCAGLSVLNVTDPVVVDDGGDGAVSPGEKFVIHANLNEIAGIGFGMYPGVSFKSSDPVVTVKENDWFYGIFACQTYDVSASGEVSANAQPGTVVTVTARVGMINEECPNAPAIQIPITIQ